VLTGLKNCLTALHVSTGMSVLRTLQWWKSVTSCEYYLPTRQKADFVIWNLYDWQSSLSFIGC